MSDKRFCLQCDDGTLLVHGLSVENGWLCNQIVKEVGLPVAGSHTS